MLMMQVTEAQDHPAPAGATKVVRPARYLVKGMHNVSRDHVHVLVHKWALTSNLPSSLECGCFVHNLKSIAMPGDVQRNTAQLHGAVWISLEGVVAAESTWRA